MDNIPVQTTFSKDKFIFSIKEEVTGYDYIAFKFNTDTILEIKQNGLSFILKSQYILKFISISKKHLDYL
ncbi:MULTISPECIES: hypothetical protein [Pedobacter]|uniref:hypothetical protein n=1 Tax=Pedobacter TaxID=84567 RepID=UPI001E5259B1|nr:MULTISPECIES: hypothetical protein [Pedobacter]